MTRNSRSTYREIEVDNEFGRAARAPGGLSRSDALAHAEAEIERVKPQVSQYIKQECARLGTALRSARTGKRVDSSAVAQAYTASQHLRDVADSVGHPLVGLIATNLCNIFEAVELAQIDYPGAVIDCHFDALRLALSRRYRGKKLKDLPELSTGLVQIVEIAKDLAARADTAVSKNVLKGLLLIEICVANRQASARQHVLQSVPELCQRNL